MLLANYASDSDSDNEASSSKPAPKVAPVPAKTAPAATKGKKRAGPIKITLDLPKSKGGSGADEDDGGEGRDAGLGEDNEDEREAKKAKIGSAPKGGKGSSSLLGMLPAPKRKLPTAIPSGSSLGVNKSMAAKPKVPVPGGTAAADDNDDDEDEPIAGSSSIMLPPSMARKAKKKEEPALDLFGLSSAPAPSTSSSTSLPSLKPPQITSAPAVADFIPPTSTPDDPYPGYYQLPGGEWAAYDPEFYHSFFSTTAEGEDESDGGKIGKYWSDFDQSAELVNVQASEGLSEAREKEARRLAAKPKRNEDEFEYKPVGQVKGLASERHQLSSLLNIAHTQREQLEDRIASNKKSARMAKTKYGF